LSPQQGWRDDSGESYKEESKKQTMQDPTAREARYREPHLEAPQHPY
jgi:hypothetical protein